MKGFTLAFLCVFAAVQGRIVNIKDVEDFTSVLAQPGENPWVVHLRIATSTGGGFLDTCMGSLIGASWVLTSASCVKDARFVWIRYGTVDPIRPELVTETSTIRLNPNFNDATGENDIALVSINRVVQSTDNILPIRLAPADLEIPAQGRFCGYDSRDSDTGEPLRCADATLELSTDGVILSDSAPIAFNFGAPLVADGVQIGVLINATSSAGVFLNTAAYLPWIQEVTGVQA